MLENIKTATAVVTATKPYINKICSYLAKETKNFTSDVAIETGRAFKEYIESAKTHNSKIKTFLYSREGRLLEEVYVCIDVIIDEKVIETNDIRNVIGVANRILITGTGGIGKTTMLKYLFLNCLKNTNLVPVWVDLRTINNMSIENFSMEELVYNILKIHKFKVGQEHFKRSLELDCYLFFFDGFDEISNDKSGEIAEKLRNMAKRYDCNYYIISSRPDEQYNAWNEFVELSTMDMDKDQAIQLIEKLELVEENKRMFVYELENGLFEKHRSFASNPLLLTIMLLTYQESLSIPDNLNDFYEQAFVALFNRHDVKKGFKREIKSRLNLLDFRDVFSYFCFKTFMDQKYEFSEGEILDILRRANKRSIVQNEFDESMFLHDMQKSVCLIVQDGINYKFSHRSFQEYFAARYTCKLLEEEQKEILKDFIYKGRNRSNNYIEMLWDLQKHKVEEVLVYPIVKEVKELFSIDNIIILLKKIFSGFIFDIEGESVRICYSMADTRNEPENRYMALVDLLHSLYDLRIDETAKKEREQNAKELINTLGYSLNDEEILNFSILSFDLLNKDNATGLFVKATSWQSILSLIETIVEKYSNKKVANDAESILNEI